VIGEVVTPGGDDQRYLCWGAAGEHALVRDAQRVHHIRLQAVQQLEVVFFHAGDGQWTQPVAQRGGESAVTRNHFAAALRVTAARLAAGHAGESHREKDGLVNPVNGLAGVGGDQVDGVI